MKQIYIWTPICDSHLFFIGRCHIFHVNDIIKKYCVITNTNKLYMFNISILFSFDFLTELNSTLNINLKYEFVA